MKTKVIALFLILAASVNAQSWSNDFGKSDKNSIKHYWISNLGTMGLGYGYYKLTDKPMLSSFLGGLTMFGVGYAKEVVWDGKMGKGNKSTSDLFFDGWGSLTGMLQCRVVIDLEQRKYENIDTTKFQTFNKLELK